MAKLGNQALKIKGNELVFPFKPRQFIHISLHKRVLQVLRDAKLGAITITLTTIHVAYSRMVEVKKPKGTSSTCLRCGSKLKEYPKRQVECSYCGYHEDRDITACLNLLKTSDVSLRLKATFICTNEACIS